MPIAFRPLRHATTRLLICLLVAATVGSPAAQVASGRETTAASVAAYALSEDMPVDPEVLVGGLPNGLRYYVRPNAKPARQAELRLVVKAGSVLEDDDQQGLAHFVEHMQFEGTRHFPGTEHRRLPGVARPEHRRGRERGDELRRHAVHAARADRRARRARSRAARARGLGAAAPPSIRAGIERERGIVLSEWRMQPRRRRADRRTRSAACSSRDRATRIGRRSATRRSSRRRSANS